MTIITTNVCLIQVNMNKVIKILHCSAATQTVLDTRLG